MSAGDLARRFARRLREGELLRRGERVVVAVSGGVDSVVLLHLLRFGSHGLDLDLVVGHVDHRMRPSSAGDAAWVRGLARAWSLPARARAAAEPPESEEDARRLRYAVLEELREEAGARVVATGHHADDQAETVLFRVFRGTGVRGLAGIPEERRPGIVRPLLPFFRAEIEAYARARGVRWRTDPTNLRPGPARNRLRRRVLPEVEEHVAPGARAALVRLARIARENEEGWESLLPGLLEEVEIGEERSGVSLDRARLLDYHPHVRARLIRALARRFGTTLDESGTRAALEFIISGASGREMQLRNGLRIGRDFDAIRLRRATEAADEEPSTDRPLRIESPGSDSGELRVGGRRMRVAWSTESPPPGRWQEAVDPDSIRFPLTLRSWEPGDRLHLPYGTKKLKKLFGEEKIPRSRRTRVPVLVDAEESVVWVPGVARGDAARVPARGASLYVTVTDVDED